MRKKMMATMAAAALFIAPVPVNAAIHIHKDEIKLDGPVQGGAISVITQERNEYDKMTQFHKKQDTDKMTQFRKKCGIDKMSEKAKQYFQCTSKSDKGLEFNTRDMQGEALGQTKTEIGDIVRGR